MHKAENWTFINYQIMLTLQWFYRMINKEMFMMNKIFYLQIRKCKKQLCVVTKIPLNSTIISDIALFLKRGVCSAIWHSESSSCSALLLPPQNHRTWKASYLCDWPVWGPLYKRRNRAPRFGQLTQKQGSPTAHIRSHCPQISERIRV